MMKVNEMVQIHEGYASVGGMFINEKFTTGTVVKVNAKSSGYRPRGYEN